MKLFIQVPCLNEAEDVGSVIRDIPRQIEGIDDIKVLIVDDGSNDGTARVAYKEGADYVVKLPYRQGLAKAFFTGVNKCLEMGADIIVNTDGDHQYDGRDIPKLIQPILTGKADMVIGDRQTSNLSHFSFVKKKLQRLGSKMVSLLSGIEVPDATSGFRAYSREAALRLNVFSKFSYTLETIIQAGKNQISVAHVPVTANGPRRESRLFPNLTTYLKRSIATILRIYALYEPLRTLLYIGGAIMLIGGLGVLRFLWFYLNGSGTGHVQSLILSGVFLIIGFQVWILGIFADLISVNRRLSEEILYRTKKAGLRVENEFKAESQKELGSTPFRKEPQHADSGPEVAAPLRRWAK